jgi:hypothetical protein
MAIHEGMLKFVGESPYDEKWLDRPGADDRITTKLDVRDFLWARTGALQAHATQVDPTEKFWFGLTDEQLAEVYPYEDWVLARSLVAPRARRARGGAYEPDLFAGLRDPEDAAIARRGVGWCRMSASSTASRSGRRTRRSTGPDDADVVVTIAAADAGIEPSVAYMQGRLKAAGHTGLLFEVLRNGEAAAAISRLASRPLSAR